MALAWAGQDARWALLGVGLLGWHALLRQPGWLQRRWALPAALGLSVALAYALDVRIAWVRGLDGVPLGLGAWSLPATAGWVALIASALKGVQRHGSPRLALLVGWVVCLALVTIAALQGQSPVGFAFAVSLGLLAALSWALLRGRTLSAPASQGLGLLLALAAIAGMAKTSATLALLAPLLMLGLPSLTLQPALGILPVRLQRQHPARLLGLYVGAAALSVLVVAWNHQPEAAIVLLSLALLGAGAWWAVGARFAGGWAATSGRRMLFGVSFHALSFDQALAAVDAFIRRGTPHLVVTPDTTALMRSRHDPELQQCYRQADLVTPDGTGIVWATRWLGAPLPERVTGIDLMQALCRQAALRGQRVFLLGAAPGVAAQAAHHLKRSCPNLNVVGVHHGYFAGKDASVIDAVRAARPDLLFVGLGVPLQERWLARHKHTLGVPVMMGVGGSLDVIAGRLPRAPHWVRRAGLEWAFRLGLEPHRLGRVASIPAFVSHVARLKAAQKVEALYRSLGSTTSASSN